MTRSYEETTRSFIMLAITDNAVAVIRDLTGTQNAPDGAGLRIATDASAGSLTLSLAPQPEEGDQVLDASGARLFLDSGAAQVLDDKALDAAVDDQGAVQFAVAEQPR
jgi:iron-sulfur cluster assembly protein